MLVAGVDGCRSGWICVVREIGSGEIHTTCFDDIRALLTTKPTAKIVAVDIPIGLLAKGSRLCDIGARRVLGWPRRSSVFPAPIRPVLKATEWSDASAIRKRIEGKGISKQVWAIVEKIREVDRALRSNPRWRKRVREVHPEVCFSAWSGMPMQYKKRSAQGRAERSKLVADYFGAVAFQKVRRNYPRKKDIADDDILDAFAALWTAERIASNNARTLPEEPPVDAFGLRMEIVY